MVASVRMKNNPDARVFFDVQNVSGTPAYIRVFNPDMPSREKPEPIGYVLFSEFEQGSCLLIHIWVDSRYRRQGYGSTLISLLKETCDTIITGMSEPCGRELCLSNGFRLHRGHFNRDMPQLVWHKEGQDAKGNGKKAKKKGKRKGAEG